MKKVFISEKANGILREYLRSLGYSPVNISTNGIVDEPISCHPDVFMCKLGVDDDSPVIFASGSDVGFGYPSDSVFNAACTGEFFFHKLAVTNPRLLSVAGSFSKTAPTGMKFVDVRQGYTKCSMVVVDRNSIITYDKGIIKACSMYPEINVLEVEPGHCFLEGYDTGFIGGCSGNTQGVSRLIEGMDVDEAIRRIDGIDCGGRGTSCPDQLARALKEYKAAN